MPRRTQANNKTQSHDGNVNEYLNSVAHQGRREDSFALLKIMSDVTGEKPTMWGPSIVGFGRYHYMYESGREGDSFLTGFAPRKANLVVYVMPGFERYEQQLMRLGKHRTGSSCLYLGRLERVDIQVLTTLIEDSVAFMRAKWGG